MLENRVRRGLLPAVVLAVVLALGGSASAQTLHVLSVGCPGKKGSDPKHHRALGIIKEAKKVAALFKAQEGKSFDRVETRCLTDAEATRDNIRRALEDLPRQAQEGDRVVVFLGGHGDTDPVQGWVFETYDCDSRPALVTADLHKTVGTLPSRKIQVILFVNTCHAGALDLQKDGVVVFAACLANEPSSFRVTSTDEIGNIVDSDSVFACALIAGLEGKADANRDGIVTLAELEGYVAERVSRTVRYPDREHTSCGRPLAVPSNLALVMTGPARPRPGQPAVTLPPESHPGH